MQQDLHLDDDVFYEDLIGKLYKPAKITVGNTIGKGQNPPFVVEKAEDPEPAVDPEPAAEEQPQVIEPEPEPVEEPRQQTTVEKWRGWLNNLVKDVTE